VNKLPISVCVISGAEVRRIGKSLSSVAEWTSEIIVVINEEIADGTDRVIDSFGGRVHRRKWQGFAAQKNAAFDLAVQPWILGLDADEVVSPGLRDEIIRLFESQPIRAAYSFPRCSYYFGRWIRHGDWYPDRCVRLVRRGKARWQGIDPHARLEVDGGIGRLRHELLHYTAESLAQQVEKTVLYANTFAEHCSNTGRRVTALDLAFRPPWRFFRGYIIRLGLLDGWQGFAIAWMSAFYVFLRYARAREAQLPVSQ
jgi:glycosyltransferase involved in cell wall biosynthesis